MCVKWRRKTTSEIVWFAIKIRQNLLRFIVAVVVIVQSKASRCRCKFSRRRICVDIHLNGIRHFGAITWHGHFARLNDRDGVWCDRNGHRTGKMQTPVCLWHKRFSRKPMNWGIFTTMLNFHRFNLSVVILWYQMNLN